MSNHLTGSQTPTMDEFLIIVKAGHEVELKGQNFEAATNPNLAALVAPLDRATLRSRLGSFPRLRQSSDAYAG